MGGSLLLREGGHRVHLGLHPRVGRWAEWSARPTQFLWYIINFLSFRRDMMPLNLTPCPQQPCENTVKMMPDVH